MPDTANRIRQQLGLDESFNDQGLDTVAEWGGLPSGLSLGKPEPIFPRKDTKKAKQKSKETPAEAEQSTDENLISFDQFQELDLRVAEVIAAEKVPNADRLLKLQVNLGVRNVKSSLASQSTIHPKISLESRLFWSPICNLPKSEVSSHRGCYLQLKVGKR